jgi:hypothetical protein
MQLGEDEALEIALLDVGSAVAEAVREVGRTVRHALKSDERTARLAVLMIIVIIAWYLLY